MTTRRRWIAGAVLAAVVAAPALALPQPALAAGTPTERTTFVTPIWEGALASNGASKDLPVLEDMKSELGAGGSGVRLGWSFSSWALSRDIQPASTGYAFDPTNLQYMLGLAKTADMPVVVHMNNGRWADCCNSDSTIPWNPEALDAIAKQPHTTMEDSAGTSLYAHDAGRNFFSLSRLNTAYRDFRKQNITASARTIASWAADNPALFAGVSLSSETQYDGRGSDYGPFAVQEWRQWLAASGMYGPGGAYAGQGRPAAFDTVQSFNTAMGTDFATWSDVTPPKTIVPGDPFSEEWSRWRVVMMEHSLADETRWIASSGIDRNVVYGHQTPQYNYYDAGDDVRTNMAANGASGITRYGGSASDFGRFLPPVRAQGKNNYGMFEFNPTSTNAALSDDMLTSLFDSGIKIICPNGWMVGGKNEFAINDGPSYGNVFRDSLQRFIASHADTPRLTEPEPWNPGRNVYDFVDQFASSTRSGIDNHTGVVTVGGASQRSLFSHLDGTVTYPVKLPAVSGSQRLNLWTQMGVQDGARNNPGARLQISVDGTNLFGPGFDFGQDRWAWKRWTPTMVDVTAWAGKTVSISFTTRASTADRNDGWIAWGAPAIYQTGGSDDLARDKSVTVSSTDGGAQGWDARYVVDGNIDGGVAGRNGWSSALHSSATGTESVRVDLGTTTSVRKVVLFPRSDLTTSANTGFPRDFVVQTSVDGSTWSAASTQTGYPDVKAGDGEVLAFTARDARYVRVVASKLGAVGTESGYRFQLADLQVFG